MLQPVISIDLVTDPLFIQAAKQGQTTLDESQITQPSLLFSIPAHFLLSSKHFPKKHMCFINIFLGMVARIQMTGSFMWGSQRVVGRNGGQSIKSDQRREFFAVP